jgi:glycosyltransferase involved in cell wall biosynthesis
VLNSRPRIGFAALWQSARPSTWSHIPHNLLTGMLEADPAVIDLDLELRGLSRFAVRAMGARISKRRPVTLWRSVALTDWLVDQRLEVAADVAGIDVVFQIADLWHTDRPYVTYRDEYWGQIEQLHEEFGDMSVLGHPGFNPRHLRKRAQREDSLLRDAGAVVAFSEWAAAYLRDDLRLDPARIHVVPPGANVLQVDGLDEILDARVVRPHRRLLFVGVDFVRKGGPALLDAFEIVRSRRPDTTLTVAGPQKWPMAGPPGPGVEFVGRLSISETTAAFAEHDLFVMPSVFEPFGIAYVEAQANGLPCIGPARFAVPEIVKDGQTGRLVGSRDPEELAEAILAALDDDDLYRSTVEAVPSVRRRFRWDRAGRQAVEICRSVVACHSDTPDTTESPDGDAATTQLSEMRKTHDQ